MYYMLIESTFKLFHSMYSSSFFSFFYRNLRFLVVAVHNVRHAWILWSSNSPSFFYRERLLETRGNFLLLYDSRLFKPELHYIWNRIINVVFVRQYSIYKYRSGERIFTERIDLTTVYYPSRKRDFTEMKYIDTWNDGKLRYGNDHYMSKTTNLQGNALRSVARTCVRTD